MKLFVLFIVGIFLPQGCSKYFESQQSVGITGQLECQGSPAVGVKVELTDYGKEGKLDEGTTDAHGRFHLFGVKPRKDSKLAPLLIIYTGCLMKEGQKKVMIEVPTNFVRSGVVPEVAINMGKIKLADFVKRLLAG